MFHVQEHRFTLPLIRKFVADNALTFIGFEAKQRTKRDYLEMFPGDHAMLDLDRWHRFEEAYQATFEGMYRFWVQKPG